MEGVILSVFGVLLFGKKPEKTHVFKRAVTIPFHGSNSSYSGDKRVYYPLHYLNIIKKFRV